MRGGPRAGRALPPPAGSWVCRLRGSRAAGAGRPHAAPPGAGSSRGPACLTGASIHHGRPAPQWIYPFASAIDTEVGCSRGASWPRPHHAASRLRGTASQLCQHCGQPRQAGLQPGRLPACSGSRLQRSLVRPLAHSVTPAPTHPCTPAAAHAAPHLPHHAEGQGALGAAAGGLLGCCAAGCGRLLKMGRAGGRGAAWRQPDALAQPPGCAGQLGLVPLPASPPSSAAFTPCPAQVGPRDEQHQEHLQPPACHFYLFSAQAGPQDEQHQEYPELSIEDWHKKHGLWVD